jgi:hypothetical protein
MLQGRRAEASGTEPAATARRFPRLAEPARFRLAGAVLVAGVILLGVVGFRSATDRHNAANELGAAATPRLAAAEDVYVYLTDADAAASTAFLRGRLEPLELRQRYDADMQNASRAIATIAGSSGNSRAAKQALVVLDQQVPVYAGLVESSRSNNRQGFPVGASYLRSASALMRGQILPATTTIYEDAARQTSARYRDGTAADEVTAVAVVAAIVLVLLLGTQIALALATRRILNIGLVVATVLVVAVGSWLLAAFAQERAALVSAREHGSDALQVLSTSRILTLRSFSDENLELVERGDAPEYLPDFARVSEQLLGDQGLLAYAERIDNRGTPGAPELLTTEYNSYLRDHDAVRNDVYIGDYRHAVMLVSRVEAPRIATLDGDYEQAIKAARDHIDTNARDARNALTGAAVGSLLLAALAAVAIALGLRRRIQEFS